MTYRFALAVLFYHLWRHIIGSSTNGKSAFLLLDLGCEAKVTDLQPKAIAQKQVTELDVPVYYILVVQLFQP